MQVTPSERDEVQGAASLGFSRLAGESIPYTRLAVVLTSVAVPCASVYPEHRTLKDFSASLDYV